MRRAIHAYDALTVAIGGIGSSGKNHEDAAKLLVKIAKGKDVKEMSSRFLGIIRMKDPVDYDPRLLRKEMPRERSTMLTPSSHGW